MRGEPWRLEDTEMLRQLWSAGETAATIGAKLGGLSRSAVLGKIFRLRLGAAGKSPAASGVAAPGRRRAGKLVILPPVKPERRGKTLFELTNACCRWPYKRPGAEKYFFCGAPEADLENGIPYCPRHMRRAYLVPPPLVVRKSSTTKPWTATKPMTAEERHARDWRKRQASDLKRVFGGR
ncbi:MAG TPA: GcrA family cell cycle regulator [Xanthobacteraceae bacterium]|nr:GcrA family cell cycle regulator [Xanthobacteraceae bacterium]